MNDDQIKEEPYIEDAVGRLVGKRCSIETTDGSLRVELVRSVGYSVIQFGKKARARFPTTLFFDEMQVDGVELNVVEYIEVLSG